MNSLLIASPLSSPSCVLANRAVKAMLFSTLQLNQTCLQAQPSSLSSQLPSSLFNQRRGLADEKAVKNRMRSVQSIQKITKAMKMVAASKLRHDQKRREMGMPFCRPAIELFNRLPFSEALTTGLATTTSMSGLSNKDIMLVCLSSDKGLCGGVNSAIARLSRLLIKQEESRAVNVSIIGVGDKIRAALQRLFGDRFSRIIDEVVKVPLNFGLASIIAERIAQSPVSRVAILHNRFRSVISFDTQQMPVASAAQALTVKRTNLDMFEFEPEQALLWNDLHEFYLACSVFNCLLENGATEQSQRMAAMDNASKNAGEMLSRLTLSYNKARQMKITMELIEIISGANAL